MSNEHDKGDITQRLQSVLKEDVRKVWERLGNGQEISDKETNLHIAIIYTFMFRPSLPATNLEKVFSDFAPQVGGIEGIEEFKKVLARVVLASYEQLTPKDKEFFVFQKEALEKIRELAG